MPITHRDIQTRGIRMHVAEVGEGPLVLLCHGFPECWYSWQAQMLALAAAGYRAVAPDMRGYGGTEAPQEVDQFTLFHLAGDMIALLDALEVHRAVVVGHDWGAPVAWHTALFRPDRVRGVAGLSVPWFPRNSRLPSQAMPADEKTIFYQRYFCQEGVAEREFGADVREALRRIAWLWSADCPEALRGSATMVQRDGPMLMHLDVPAGVPHWMTGSDLDVYEAAFKQSGFRGPLNWYRNLDRNWSLNSAWSGATISTPSMFLVGERDMVLSFRGVDRLLASLQTLLPGLQSQVIVPGRGHWIQREAADTVNAALLGFLRTLPA